MQSVEYNEYFKEATESLSDGAFLTVKNNDELNTMTIGWATIGIIWGIPVLIVLVRESRHTFQLIEDTDEFTVSFSFDGSMKEELNFCGTKSGRHYDKFDECDLEAVPGQDTETPVIGECDLHYECKIIYKQAMDQDNIMADVVENCYPGQDYHTMYFGEIINCYLED